MPSKWSGAAVDPGGGKPTPGDWQPVEVPGRPAAFAGEDRVAYRTVFDDPRDPDDDLGLLELRGCYAAAEVWLNDELVAEPDAVFDPVRVPFEPEAENELVVECRAPEDRFGGIHDTDRVPAERSVPGIWWGVDVTGQPDPFVVDVDLRPRVTDDGASIDAAVEVYAGESLDDRLTLTTKPAGDRRGRGMMDRASVTAGAGERAAVEKSIDVRDPSLWWPRGMGRQHRYEVRAKLGDGARTSATGIATVQKTDAGGLRVNGEDVPVRGVALTDAAVADAERAVEVNANLVRAHAHPLSEAMYDACDEAGLLVWQDLPLTGPGVFDIARGQDLAQRLVDTYAHHPSLAALSVHDEPTDTFAERVGSGLVDRLRFRYRVWRSDYDRGAAEAVAEAVPDGVAVYPVVGEPGTDPDAAALYPGWDYGGVDDLDWVRERYDLDGAVGEFGAGSLPEGVDPDADDFDPAGFDRAKHDAVVGSDDPAASQAYQAELARGIAERLRTDGVSGSDATGGSSGSEGRERTDGAPVVVANALRDAGDAGMGVYARDGTPKDAVESLAAAFEPVQAFLVGASAGECDVIVANDAPESIAGTVTWEAGAESSEVDVTVDAGARAVVDTIDVPRSASSVELSVRVGETSVENTYRL
ncbi:hydrolase [Halosimplex litoreum]|uniref:Hydrolase n=1 Tax=Halosimplex litoreum TaxID=1198301 RepID=A0A7T3KWB8_9EURY|nr:hydrolase [Halosimplex litoreum]QPV63765.1 hydrolase [Halosimplex litoreum]